jgi:hypothetical protein
MTSQDPPGLPSKPRARADQDALNFSVSQAATTVVYSESGSGKGDDSESSASMYTYASADAGKFKREEDGRVRNFATYTSIEL